MTTVSLIVAYSQNRAIGKDNELPWRLPSDLAHFKRHTLGRPIIMGRKTWESLGRPLPGRLNIVLSRSEDASFPGAMRADSIERALQLVGTAPEVFIIGGAQVYEQALPRVSRIIATEVDTTVEADAFFPELDSGEWEEVSREVQPPENGLHFAFVEYRRRT